MNILYWLINRFKKENDEDIENEINDLLQKVREINPIITNPHNREYHQKLTNLFQSVLSARDNFINWITGLATGAIFFVFTRISSATINTCGLKWAGRVLFGTIISALLFKLFFEVRHSALKFEVHILGTLWERKELNQEVKKMLEKQGEADKETKKKFLKNHREHLRFLDNKYIERLKKPGMIQLRALNFFYYLTLGTFMLSIILLAITYLF